jgi:magnesium-transporting ATPase (P-type)
MSQKYNGLTSAEFEERIDQFGLNKLSETKPDSILKYFVHQTNQNLNEYQDSYLFLTNRFAFLIIQIPVLNLF